MSEYLRAHPDVCFSEPKEPHHFATDMPTHCPGTTDEEYLRRYFGHCGADARAVGEGSVHYLFSRVAVDNILRFRPEARFIVMLRDPVDLVHAYHQEMLWQYSEDVLDFERAWDLQGPRRAGERIPPTCRDPRVLQYREIGSLGSQLERLLGKVPRERVHVVIFDDFVDATKEVYEAALRFLGLPSDGREQFPRVNPAKRHALRPLGRFTQRPPRRLVGWAQKVKDWLGIERLGIVKALRAWNRRAAERPPLRPGFRERLRREFEDEVTKIERLTGRDLGGWRSPEGGG